MSEISEIVTIEPPVGLSYPSARIEYLKSKIYTCPVCNGSGGRWNDQHSLRSEKWTICSMCIGTGQIQAEITHKWVSVGEVKELLNNEEDNS